MPTYITPLTSNTPLTHMGKAWEKCLQYAFNDSFNTPSPSIFSTSAFKYNLCTSTRNTVELQCTFGALLAAEVAYYWVRVLFVYATVD